MTIKELKKFIKAFPDNSLVVVGGWFHDGQRYYMPNATIAPFRLNKGKEKKVAIIGHFDDCLAHMWVSPGKGRGR